MLVIAMLTLEGGCSSLGRLGRVDASAFGGGAFAAGGTFAITLRKKRERVYILVYTRNLGDVVLNFGQYYQTFIFRLRQQSHAAETVVLLPLLFVVLLLFGEDGGSSEVPSGRGASGR